MYRRLFFLNVGMIIYINMISNSGFQIFSLIFEKAQPQLLPLMLQTFLIALYVFVVSGLISYFFNSYNDLVIIKSSKNFFYLQKIGNIYLNVNILILNMYLYIIIFDFNNIQNYSILNFVNLYLVFLFLNSGIIIIEAYMGYEISIMIFLIYTSFESVLFSIFKNSNILMIHYYFVDVNFTKTLTIFIINIIMFMMMFKLVKKKDRLGEKCS